MAKLIEKFKLKNLSNGVPTSGHLGIGKELFGAEYDYSSLKKSMQENGYNPEEYDYIASNADGVVKYGSRRVWLMQNDMGMDQETEVDCEVWTDEEWEKEQCDKLGVKDYMAEWDSSKKEIIPPKESVHTLSDLHLDLQPFIDYHKMNPDIEGYDYAFKVTHPDGTTKIVDAGKA